jgi:hypothetical protein
LPRRRTIGGSIKDKRLVYVNDAPLIATNSYGYDEVCRLQDEKESTCFGVVKKWKIMNEKRYS